MSNDVVKSAKDTSKKVVESAEDLVNKDKSHLIRLTGAAFNL